MTNWAFFGDIISVNLSLVDGSRGISILFINSFRGISYVGHSRRKCISSSTLSGQNGQNLFSLGVLGDMCLPFSILRMWFKRRYYSNYSPIVNSLYCLYSL